MTSMPRLSRIILLALLSSSLLRGAVAQERHERTLDEIKTEAIHRAENGMYPLIGLDPGDDMGTETIPSANRGTDR